MHPCFSPCTRQSAACWPRLPRRQWPLANHSPTHVFRRPLFPGGPRGRCHVGGDGLHPRLGHDDRQVRSDAGERHGPDGGAGQRRRSCPPPTPNPCAPLPCRPSGGPAFPLLVPLTSRHQVRLVPPALVPSIHFPGDCAAMCALWGFPRLGRRLEEVAEAVGGGYCRLQMPLRPALGVGETVRGDRRHGTPPPDHRPGHTRGSAAGLEQAQHVPPSLGPKASHPLGTPPPSVRLSGLTRALLGGGPSAAPVGGPAARGVPGPWHVHCSGGAVTPAARGTGGQCFGRWASPFLSHHVPKYRADDAPIPNNPRFIDFRGTSGARGVSLGWILRAPSSAPFWGGPGRPVGAGPPAARATHARTNARTNARIEKPPPRDGAWAVSEDRSAQPFAVPDIGRRISPA